MAPDVPVPCNDEPKHEKMRTTEHTFFCIFSKIVQSYFFGTSTVLLSTSYSYEASYS